MLRNFIIALLFPAIALSQNNYPKHFWGSALIAGGIRVTLSETPHPEVVLYSGLIGVGKEVYDHYRHGKDDIWMNLDHKSDLWADITGAVCGFIIFDPITRKIKTIQP